MANVTVYNMEGNAVGQIELNDAIFGVDINEHLVHMAVVQQLANDRQGTQKAKTRGEVSGGGRKPYRQKGTGHARQGSTRSPQWKGGGVVFAPTPRSYSFKLNKKEKRAALKSALTSRVNENKFYVIDDLSMDAPKTKTFGAMLKALNLNKALVVLDEIDEKIMSDLNILSVSSGIDDHLVVFVTDKREKDLVMDYIRKEFAVIRRSFSVAVIPEFPRNDAGKILYGKLLERAKTLIAEQDSSMA